MSTKDMPTVDELRQIARRAYATMRATSSPLQWARACDDIRFVHDELPRLTGNRDVLDQELRRDAFLRRGYTPPEDFETAISGQPPESIREQDGYVVVRDTGGACFSDGCA